MKRVERLEELIDSFDEGEEVVIFDEAGDVSKSRRAARFGRFLQDARRRRRLRACRNCGSKRYTVERPTACRSCGRTDADWSIANRPLFTTVIVENRNSNDTS
ncbi:hypothetical protein [Halomarina oriensis]|uniref:Uncharacterized protein n=1 Tax=Halomarina oriensis TaxID=671145 RepID=A0A6B0GLW4_9EURY|nr:hypothetical protein [Halomarina oriensis]MWG33125.1 hypothetical protein [Halomarina oriensis]